MLLGAFNIDVPKVKQVLWLKVSLHFLKYYKGLFYYNRQQVLDSFGTLHKFAITFLPAPRSL